MKVDVPGLKASSGEAYPTIPAGSYPVGVTKLEPRENKPSDTYPNGSMSLLVQVTVAPGEENAGHKLSKFMKIPPYPKEMDDGKQAWHTNQLKRLCIACGLDITKDSFDTDQLFGQQFTAVVSWKDDGTGPKNEIRDYLTIG